MPALRPASRFRGARRDVELRDASGYVLDRGEHRTRRRERRREIRASSPVGLHVTRDGKVVRVRTSGQIDDEALEAVGLSE